MEGVRHWLGIEVEAAADVAVDYSGDKGDGVSVGAEKGYSKKHMVEGVIVPGVGDANPVVIEEVLADDSGLLSRCGIIDFGMGSTN